MGLFGKSKKEREKEYMNRLDVPLCLKEDFELIIDDVFTIMGVGTVATGNISTGMCREGENACVYKANGGVLETIITTIRRILTNRKYIGITSYHGQDYNDIVPAIVDNDLFNQVQIMMQKNKKAPARAKATDEQYILTTKLYCGECRAPMTGISGYSHTGVPYQYYSCVNARKKGNVCHKSNVRKDLVENAVVKVIRNTMSDATIVEIAKEIVSQDKKANSSSNLAALQNKLKTVKIAQENLLHAIEQGQAIDVLTAQLAKRQAEEQQLEASIAREKLQNGKNVTVEDVIDYLTRIRNGSEDNILYRQSLVNIYVDSIYLYDTPDGKNKRISILLKTQNGVKEIPIDDLESSPMGQMVHHRGLEPRTH